MTSPEDALAAARAFATAGPARGAERLGSGHIHDTFSVACHGPDGRVRYVLQRLNDRVFPDPHAVIENVALLTRSLAARAGAGDRSSLRCIATREGSLGHTDAAGRIWRAFARIEGARTFDRVESPDQARRAARAFGGFAASLGDLAPDALHLTIPGFHDFEARVRALEHAVEADPAGRARAASDDIESARRAARALASELPPARLERLPLRVVHNDCKLNNVLFDESSGEALCVIDLDTVMPGTLLVDFGDLVRTAACPAAEDERDLSRVRVDPELYDALSRGYLEGIGGAIGTDEIELLPLAGPRIALETGIRFLTDHLEGDVYFRVSREGHNLDRARSQIRLTERLLGELAAARRRIERAARG